MLDYERMILELISTWAATGSSEKPLDPSIDAFKKTLLSLIHPELESLNELETGLKTRLAANPLLAQFQPTMNFSLENALIRVSSHQYFMTSADKLADLERLTAPEAEGTPDTNLLNNLISKLIQYRESQDKAFEDSFTMFQRAKAAFMPTNILKATRTSLQDLLAPQDIRTFKQDVVRNITLIDGQPIVYSQASSEMIDHEMTRLTHLHTFEELGGLHQGLAGGSFDDTLANYTIDDNKFMSASCISQCQALLEVTKERASYAIANLYYCVKAQDPKNPSALIDYAIKDNKLIILDEAAFDELTLDIGSWRKDNPGQQDSSFFESQGYSPIFKLKTRAELNFSNSSTSAQCHLGVVCKHPGIVKYVGPAPESVNNPRIQLSSSRLEHDAQLIQQYELYRQELIELFTHELQRLNARNKPSSTIIIDIIDLDTSLNTLKHLNDANNQFTLDQKIEKMYEICHKVKKQTFHGRFARIINFITNKVKTFFGLKETSLLRTQVAHKAKALLKHLDTKSDLFFKYDETKTATKGAKRTFKNVEPDSPTNSPLRKKVK